MANELNRYCIKIRTILQIGPKTIHEELVTAVEASAPSYTTVTRWVKCFRQGRENVNDDLRSTSVHYPNLQVKILNCFNKLSAMIHIQLMMKLYLRLLSLSHDTIERIIYDCTKMKKLHLVGYPIN